MENVKYILTVLEASARGKVIDDKLLLDRSRAVYHWATELEYASSGEKTINIFIIRHIFAYTFVRS